MTHRLDETASGVYIISATPFTETGAVDAASTERLVEFYVDSGVAGITILGMMGEAPKLASEETEAFLKLVLARVAGRLPVVVGVSGPGLDNLVRLSHTAMDQGAAGVMVAPVPGLGHDDKLYGYYAELFARLGGDIPLVYQDYPQATGVQLSVACFNRLVADFPSLVMLKHEDCPGLAKLSAIRVAGETGTIRRVSILTGNGGLYLPQELARGADGAMTGFAYPEMLVQVVDRFRAGDRDGAEDLFDAYLPLIRHEQQPGFGLAVRKEVLRRRSVIACAATRAPGPKLAPTDHDELSRLIARVEARLGN